eukprot:5204077-Pyramimonas_sp.AAC.3
MIRLAWHMSERRGVSIRIVEYGHRCELDRHLRVALNPRGAQVSACELRTALFGGGYSEIANAGGWPSSRAMNYNQTNTNLDNPKE